MRDKNCIEPFATLYIFKKKLKILGGNVLTSQRVVDVVLKAFEAAAASCGCMNNFCFGDGSKGYYETICGGAGAGPSWEGNLQFFLL